MAEGPLGRRHQGLRNGGAHPTSHAILEFLGRWNVGVLGTDLAGRWTIDIILRTTPETILVDLWLCGAVPRGLAATPSATALNRDVSIVAVAGNDFLTIGRFDDLGRLRATPPALLDDRRRVTLLIDLRGRASNRAEGYTEEDGAEQTINFIR